MNEEANDSDHPSPPEKDPDARKHEPSVFAERSPENLERFIEMVEGLQEDHAKKPEWAMADKDIEEGPANPESYQVLQSHFENSKLNQQRPRPPHRLRYEAEVEVIKKQVGSLEDIRTKLGISRRKICQLLMVDPSAWTRWVKEGAPPYIYRALEWYLLLSKDRPAEAHSYWISTVGGRTAHESDEFRKKSESLETQLQQIREQLVKQAKSPRIGLVFFFGLISGIMIFQLLYSPQFKILNLRHQTEAKSVSQ